MRMSKYPEYFGDVDDCSICPFFVDNAVEWCSDFICKCNPDGYIPCTRMDEYGDYPLDEVVEMVDSRERAKVDYYIRERQREEAIIQKKKDAVDKRKKTRFENREINSKISTLRSTINNKKIALSKIQSLIRMGNIMANLEYRENKYNNENELVNRLVAEINAYEKELARLIVVRDNMNKERRRKK